MSCLIGSREALAQCHQRHPCVCANANLLLNQFNRLIEFHHFPRQDQLPPSHFSHWLGGAVKWQERSKMNSKLSISVFLLLVMVGCTSTAEPTKTPLANTQLSPVVLLAAPPLDSTSTTTPFPTLTHSITPFPTITPQPGFRTWVEGSMPGVYNIQFPEDEWMAENDQLIHRALNYCFIARHGGNDMCMSGGCPVPTNVTFGDLAFSKMAFGNNSHAIYTSGSDLGLCFEVYSPNDPSCIEQAEEVLNTLQIRPERGCTDRVAFVADLTVPDNTVFPAGTRFTKTWRLQNAGTCTWTKRYSLVVYGRSSGTEADWVALNENVQPGKTIDISIELPAPLNEGVARWEAVLKNEFGDSFGLGSEPYTDMFGKPFWVQIIVEPPPSP